MNEVINAYRRYGEFTGRAGRREYWSFFIFFVIAAGVLSILDNMMFGTSRITDGPGWSPIDGFQPLTSIFSLISLVPCIAVSVRRMHDIGKSGWWVLINLILLIGWIWFLILAAGPGDAEANAYGEAGAPA
jgi:uncharacterized membrane protein YhaH (DUF805 family)